MVHAIMKSTHQYPQLPNIRTSNTVRRKMPPVAKTWSGVPTSRRASSQILTSLTGTPTCSIDVLCPDEDFGLLNRVVRSL
ncbi:hypothetical protein D3C71_1445380 [compost metagenome]|jgi:hypothetical protein